MSTSPPRASRAPRARRTAASPTAGWLACLLVAALGGPALAAEGAAPEAAGAASAGLDAVFVIDNSGSMRSNDPDRTTHRMVANFAALLESGSRLGLVLFDDDARLVEPLTSEVGPESAAHWSAVLARVDYSGQRTNSPAGIERALYELKSHGRSGAEQVIVFITDGIVDTGDRQQDAEKKRWLRESLAVEARRAGIRIYGIAFTEQADVELIQALALATGGEYFRVLAADDIGDVLARIGRSLSGAGAHGGVAARETTSEPQAPVPPPVGAAPPDPTRGLVLLALGVLVVALVVLYPAIERRRRTRPVPSASDGPSAAPVGRAAGAEVRPAGVPVVDRTEARLVDVGRVSRRGLLPIAIDRVRTSIGRDDSNDVVIPRDTVSSFHATIDFDDGYFYVEDHRSTNGTYLNGETLAPNSPVQLKSGDRIDFAAFEFRFIIPDHEPRGRTVVLDGTALPRVGGSPESSPDPTAAPPVAQAPRQRPADDEPGDEAPQDDAASWCAAFEDCLAAHLEKIRAAGDAHAAFVGRHFTQDLRELLSQRAAPLIGGVAADREGRSLELSRQGVLYVLCVLPETIDGARAWFESEHGGYARWLAGRLDEWVDGEPEGEALCAVTFGMCDEAWISISLLPARSGGGVPEVMSFEFLSQEERRHALIRSVADVERDG